MVTLALERESARLVTCVLRRKSRRAVNGQCGAARSNRVMPTPKNATRYVCIDRGRRWVIRRRSNTMVDAAAVAALGRSSKYRSVIGQWRR